MGPGEQPWPWDLTRSSWVPLGHCADPAQSSEPDRNHSTHTSEGLHYPQECSVLVYKGKLGISKQAVDSKFLLHWKASNFRLNKYSYRTRLESFMSLLSRREKGFWRKNSIWNMFMKNGTYESVGQQTFKLKRFTQWPTCCLMLNNWKAAASHTLISGREMKSPLH